MPNCSVPAAAEGLPEIKPAESKPAGPQPSRLADTWLRRYAGDVAQFKRCDMEELLNIYEALSAQGAALQGVYNMPRVNVEGPDGRWIELALEVVDEQRQALVEYARIRGCRDADEYDAYCQLLFRWEADCEGNPNEMLRLAQELLAVKPGRVA